MIPRTFGIYIFVLTTFVNINLQVIPTVNGEEIISKNLNNNCTKTNFKISESNEGNENIKNSFWFLNIPLLPVVVATSKSIPEGLCKKHLNLYLNHLKNGTLWATEMFDSSAKYPYGIFDGHLRHLGSFDQCFRIQTKIPNNVENGDFEEIRSRYCLVDIKYKENNEPKNFTGKLDIWFDPQGSAWESIREKGDFRRYQRYLLQMALCVPASCYPEDIVSALKEPLEKFSNQYNLQVEASIKKDLCQAAHEAKPVSNYAIAYCIVFILIIALIISSTIYDFKSSEEEKQSLKKELLFCFSARRNLESIFKVSYRHRGIDCLHMFRTIFVGLVIIGHRHIQALHTSNITGRYFEWTMTIPHAMLYHNGSIIVDGFFGIGGLVLAYQLLEFLETSKRLNILLIIIKRFLRLAPLYIFVLFAYILIFPHLSSGPFWENRFGFERDSCSTYWWANILFINNYVNGKNTCIFQSWYLAVDFQCFILGLFILGTFWKLPRKLGYTFLGSFLIVSILIPFYVTSKYDVDPLFKASGNWRRMEDYDYFTDYYVKTHMRLAPYIVGIIMGALIYDYKFATWRLSAVWSRVLFILAVVLCVSSVHFGYYFFDPNIKPSLFEKSLYASLHRPIFALSICSMVLLITIGDGLDFFYEIFTPKFVQPISKLSYGSFLLHFALQSYDLGTAKTAFDFSFYHMHEYMVVDMVNSLLFSLFSVVTIEAPFKNLGYMLLMRKNASESHIKLSEIPKKVN